MPLLKNIRHLALAALATTALADEPGGLIYYRPVERAAPKTLEFDVAVYGGTPGGFATALQSARLGKNVVLVSFDPYIGGLTSAGLTATDVGRKTAIGGMAMEFYERVGKLRDFSPSKAESTFRMFLSNKEGKVAFPKPDGYESGRYALLARFMNFDADITWTLNYTTRPMHDGPVQMRNGDSNNAGSFSSNNVNGSNFWPDGTFEPVNFAELPPPRRGLRMPLNELYQMREKIFQDHVTYQQGYMYFMANDPQVPKDLQEPVYMILGQSAGTAAAIAIDDQVAIQDVDYPKLSAKLLELDQILTYPDRLR